MGIVTLEAAGRDLPEMAKLDATKVAQLATGTLACPASPVLLVGGVGHPRMLWNVWAAELDELAATWRIVDVPRLGFAPRDAYHRSIGQARIALLDEACLPADTAVSLVGFSAGGVGSVDYLRRHPDQVDRVVAISSPLRGNEIATCTSTLLGARTPRWISDLATASAAATGLDAQLAARVTSIVGPAFDGIISARSSSVDGMQVVRATELGARPSIHQRMHERGPVVRHAAWHALA